MRIRLIAANGRDIIVRTDATAESAAYREALRRIRREYPGEGWRVFGVAF